MLSKKRIKNVKRILLLIGILFLLYLTSKAQVVLNGNQVCMPLEDYRKFRIVILQSDTLRLECDSIIIEQDKKINLKDSIIVNINNQIILKDSIIVEKNKTISQLATVTKEPKIHKQLWIGALIGTFLSLLILN